MFFIVHFTLLHTFYRIAFYALLLLFRYFNFNLFIFSWNQQKCVIVFCTKSVENCQPRRKSRPLPTMCKKPTSRKMLRLPSKSCTRKYWIFWKRYNNKALRYIAPDTETQISCYRNMNRKQNLFNKRKTLHSVQRLWTLN